MPGETARGVVICSLRSWRFLLILLPQKAKRDCVCTRSTLTLPACSVRGGALALVYLGLPLHTTFFRSPAKHHKISSAKPSRRLPLLLTRYSLHFRHARLGSPFRMPLTLRSSHVGLVAGARPLASPRRQTGTAPRVYAFAPDASGSQTYERVLRYPDGGLRVIRYPAPPLPTNAEADPPVEEWQTLNNFKSAVDKAAKDHCSSCNSAAGSSREHAAQRVFLYRQRTPSPLPPTGPNAPETPEQARVVATPALALLLLLLPHPLTPC